MRQTVLMVLIGLIFFVAFLFWYFSEINFTEDRWLRFTSLFLILSYLLVALFSKKINPSEALKYIFIWAGVGLLVLSGYAYRYELMDLKSRLLGELSPSTGQEIVAGQIHLIQAEDGHFYITAFVEGVPVKFMVDTGASNVVLTAEDAKRIGFNLENLSFTSRSATANGEVWSAPVNLKSIKIKSHIIENIAASISNNDLNTSLLGMTYLQQLKGYRVENGGMTFLY